jgi:hypothetical protein
VGYELCGCVPSHVCALQLDLSKSLRYFKSSLIGEYESFNGPKPAGMDVAERMLSWQGLPDDVSAACACVGMCTRLAFGCLHRFLFNPRSRSVRLTRRGGGGVA